MDTEHILVFFSSANGIDNWQPVERENIPDWLRDSDIVDRMIAGERVVNTEDKAPLYYRVLQPVRPREVGSYPVRGSGKSRGGIILPN